VGADHPFWGPRNAQLKDEETEMLIELQISKHVLHRCLATMLSNATKAGFLTSFLLAAGGSHAEQFEAPANRNAAEILPAELLNGPNYRVRETVTSYGYMNHWTVDSDFGVFEVTGDGALRSLIREIYAIAALKDVSKTEAFVGAVAEAAKQPFKLTAKMITDPVDTISALPKGVFRIFGNLRTGLTEKADPSEDSSIEKALFVSSWKREFAAQYGVDVYSSNTVLQKELNRVGWASAIGGLGVSAALIPFSGPAVLAFKSTRMANAVTETLKEEPPSRLRIINAEKLSAMGVSKDLAQRFLDHPAFTPHHDTIIVAALADLKDASGRDVFIEAILATQDEVSANFFTDVAQMIHGYEQTVAPIDDISIANGMIIARAKNGRALIPFALDHGVWTERASRVIPGVKKTYGSTGFSGGYELWVTGTVSSLARQQLESHGIEVTENVREQLGILD